MKTTANKIITAAVLGMLSASLPCNAKIQIISEGTQPETPAAADTTTATTETTSQNDSKPKLSEANKFAGYDFEEVVDALASSVSPLQKEMSGSLKEFSDSVKKSEELMNEGKPVEAINTCTEAINSVLASREEVLESMWDGQDYLTDQIGKVREKLSLSSQANKESENKELNPKTEFMLNDIAKRISKETDPERQKRLVRHYNTIRNLAQIRSMTEKLPPSKYKMWQNVLKVLENTAETHQRVLMGTEVLFAQFEVTLANIQDSKDLIETVEGANHLMKVVRGLDQSGQGLDNFSMIMESLQTNLDGLTDNVDYILQDSIMEIEGHTEAINEKMDIEMGQDSYSNMDSELAERIKKINNM